MNRTALLIVLVAIVGAGAGWLIGQQIRRPDLPGAPVPQAAVATLDRVPPLVLPRAGGGSVDLASFRGRPLLINYWATWCPPCVAEMPLLDAFARRQGETGVAVVGIAMDDPERVAEFLKRVPVGYPNLLEPGSRDDSSVQLGNRRSVLPFSVLADAEGRVLATHAGSFDERSLQRWVDGALKRAEG
jgi:thiol-disulfide isomerase/thioredoxin